MQLVLFLLAEGICLAAVTNPYHSVDIPELNGCLYIDGQQYEESCNVIFEDTFILVPLRKVFEILGFEANWNPDTGIHELLSSDYEIVIRYRSLPRSPYNDYSYVNVRNTTYSDASELFFQTKAESDNNNPFEGWIRFELDSVFDHDLFRRWYGRHATTNEIERFAPSPADACLINDRFYMNYLDMKILLEFAGYTLSVNRTMNAVFISKVDD